jgi:hypothetical protein
MCIERPNAFAVRQSIRREALPLNGPCKALARPDNGISQNRPNAILVCHAAEPVKPNPTKAPFRTGSASGARTLTHDESSVSQRESVDRRCGDDALFHCDRGASPAQLPTRSCTPIHQPARYLAVFGTAQKIVDSDSIRDGRPECMKTSACRSPDHPVCTTHRALRAVRRAPFPRLDDRTTARSRSRPSGASAELPSRSSLRTALTRSESSASTFTGLDPSL